MGRAGEKTYHHIVVDTPDDKPKYLGRGVWVAVRDSVVFVCVSRFSIEITRRLAAP
jgi:hypothetical protein